MKIVKPYARILYDDELMSALQRIEWAARISHRSEEAQDVLNLEQTKRFIKSVVLDHGDWSVVEHVSASVDILTDRGITHELVRHRLFGITQESTRFVNYEKKMPPSFLYPQPDVECALCLSGYEVKYYEERDMWAHRTGPHHTDVVACHYDSGWLQVINLCEEVYKGMLQKKWRPQEARSVFPNALASRIIMTCNLRNWRHFFLMRTTKEAHPSLRQWSIPLLGEFKAKVPVLFDDIEPLARQVDNIAKGR